MIHAAFALFALAAPAGDFALVNVKAMIGNGTVVDNATVVVKKGKISSVGSKPAPKGMTVVEGRGRIVTPGLIESHSMLGLVEVSQEATTNDHHLRGRKISPGFRAADGFNPMSTRIPVTREQGITTVLVAPTGDLIAGQAVLADLTSRISDLPDPTKPVVMKGTIGFPGGGSRGERWLQLRQILDDARFYKKNKRAYDKAGARALSLPRVHLQAMVPVADGKLPLLLFADRASDLKLAAQFSAKEKIPVILVSAKEAWMVTADLNKAKVPVIVQPSSQYIDFDSVHARDDNATLLAARGVKLIISAGVEWDQARRLRQEAGIAVARGLDYQAALTAITKTPAEVFGKGKSIGTLEKGKRANLVLWSGDPFELSTMAEGMWIDGQPMDLNTRQTELARKYMR